MKLIILFSLLINLINISCLSRSLSLDKERCFYDNYYTNMNIIIKYKILDQDITLPPNSNNIFRIYIQSTEKRAAFKMFYGNKLSGKFSHNIEESDRYRICIYTQSKELFKDRKFVYLQFQVQSNEDVYDPKLAKGKDFQAVNETMRRLSKNTETIEEMQKFQMNIEDKFSNVQIKSSSRLAFISICQLVVICIVGIYHVIYLRRIFKDKIWTPF